MLWAQSEWFLLATHCHNSGHGFTLRSHRTNCVYKVDCHRVVPNSIAWLVTQSNDRLLIYNDMTFNYACSTQSIRVKSYPDTWTKAKHIGESPWTPASHSSSLNCPSQRPISYRNDTTHAKQSADLCLWNADRIHMVTWIDAGTIRGNPTGYR